ncbi:glycosyltransferase family 4 protein [Sphingomonas sp. BK069]|uniref:glycosyltransferase family 4 protein n=1 Tax=Sphingomonas sp. BK069 TaxID=2586979 RepID=UPI001609A50B|nr:glycosyltransferase family 4 protein [Sphingomonas sp. BK069]MBB3346787.1 glycosyltransferase involved in cell wall biosynthesis [Sphingomonas sp. BK069]
MRVVVVASLAYSLVNFRGQLLADMVAAGHEVIACAPDDDPQVRARLADMGVALRRVPMARVGLNPLVDLGTLRALVALLRAERPEVVLAYTQKPIIYAGLAARLTRTRFYAMVSGLGHVYGEDASPRMRLLRRGVSLLYRAAVREARAVFVFNRDDRAEMLRHAIVVPDARVIQVPGSGVDVTRFAGTPPPPGPVFLMIARLLRAKGVDDFVAAARAVRARYPQARFRLLGPTDPGPDGVTAGEIARWAEEGVIDYLGETRDVRPFLAEASVFVLPSWYREGLPRTILEAMASGRAVITTDRPGCRDPIDQGANGLVVPARDPAALAAAMERFCADPALASRLGAVARRVATERYAVERVNRLLLDTMELSATRPDTAAAAGPAFAEAAA